MKKLKRTYLMLNTSDNDADEATLQGSENFLPLKETSN